MFSKNLKYFRYKENLSKKQLAEKIHISAMAITNYESGKRKPDIEIIKKLASVLNVNVSDFLQIRNESLVFDHKEFRKNQKLNQTQQEYVKESVEEYFNRFMTIVEILGGVVIPEAPKLDYLELKLDVEENALSLRKHLNLANDGPIDDLIEILENKGILVFLLDSKESNFFGLNGMVNGRPYIVLNDTMSPERNRSTIAHELAHMMFKWNNSNESEIEELATRISGAFLFPKIDAQRELGVHRSVVSMDMISVAEEYGISMWLLVKRANLLGILSNQVAREFFIDTSKMGWRKSEPVRIEKETTSLFEQLVFRAINEKEISIQKGAELLRSSYDGIVNHRYFSEIR